MSWNTEVEEKNMRVSNALYELLRFDTSYVYFM